MLHHYAMVRGETATVRIFCARDCSVAVAGAWKLMVLPSLLKAAALADSAMVRIICSRSPSDGGAWADKEASEHPAITAANKMKTRSV